VFRFTARTAPWRAATLAVCSALYGAACASHDPASRYDSIIAAGDSDYAASHRASMPDTARSAKGGSPAPLDDANILALAGDGDRLEVEVARIAVGKGTDPGVKTYARQLMDDHWRGDLEVRALAKRLNLKEKPPAQDTTAQELQHLRKRFSAIPKGLAFDTAFVHHEVEDHVNDIKEAKELESKATNPELKKLLHDELPTLQRHLERAQALSKKLGGGK
jgi:putative membrane protein